MTYKEAIEAIKSNYPPEHYTMLREALDLAMEVLQEKINEEEYSKFMENLTSLPPDKDKFFEGYTPKYYFKK